jgi:hypothetical protein
MSKFLKFVRDSAWTWGGSIIVLVTLSGQTRIYGLYISLVAFIGQVLGFLFTDDE